VGNRRTNRSSAVDVEVARWAVFEARAFLQVTDGEFDDGVTTVVGVEGVCRDGIEKVSF
jgi:hypothetical protein